MALSVKVAWDKTIILGPKAKFQEQFTKMVDTLPDEPGIYVFARKFANTVVPIYIGQASNGLRVRLKQQANNLKLMTAIASEKNGDRVLLLGLVKLAQGQQLKSALKVAEQAHIEHALTDGHALINIQGTKTKRHEVNVAGAMAHSHPFPRTMYLAVKG